MHLSTSITIKIAQEKHLAGLASSQIAISFLQLVSESLSYLPLQGNISTTSLEHVIIIKHLGNDLIILIIYTSKPLSINTLTSI